MSDPVAKHLVVHGSVQGVFYRASAVEAAEERGVAGWVRNADDGSVEMVVEGDAEAVASLEAWARRGPAHAEVTGVDAEDVDATGRTGFEQR